VKATISAAIARLGGIAARRSTGGRIVGGSSFDDVDLELGSAMIDVDHDERRRGEITYAELDETDRIRVVGVLDEGDCPTDLATARTALGGKVALWAGPELGGRAIGGVQLLDVEVDIDSANGRRRRTHRRGAPAIPRGGQCSAISRHAPWIAERQDGCRLIEMRALPRKSMWLNQRWLPGSSVRGSRSRAPA
jgi:hypothetical protein